jgi:hypothetical protein
VIGRGGRVSVVGDWRIGRGVAGDRAGAGLA